jgi:hypothetical protein
MHWPLWVVLIAVHPGLHYVLFVLPTFIFRYTAQISFTPLVRRAPCRVFLPSPPMPSGDLVGSAIAATLVGRRPSNAVQPGLMSDSSVAQAFFAVRIRSRANHRQVRAAASGLSLREKCAVFDDNP